MSHGPEKTAKMSPSGTELPSSSEEVSLNAAGFVRLLEPEPYGRARDFRSDADFGSNPSGSMIDSEILQLLRSTANPAAVT
jgi:hypothetical protein